MIRYLRKAARRVAERIASSSYDAIVMSGPATDVSQRLLSYGWSRQTLEMPPICDLGKQGDLVLWRDFERYPSLEVRLGAVDSYFSERYPSILEARRLLFLDDHAYWGDKMDYLAHTLPRTKLPPTDLAVFVAPRTLKRMPLYVGVYDDALAIYFRSLQDPRVRSFTGGLNLVELMEAR